MITKAQQCKKVTVIAISALIQWNFHMQAHPKLPQKSIKYTKRFALKFDFAASHANDITWNTVHSFHLPFYVHQIMILDHQSHQS